MSSITGKSPLLKLISTLCFWACSKVLNSERDLMAFITTGKNIGPSDRCVCP